MSACPFTWFRSRLFDDASPCALEWTVFLMLDLDEDRIVVLFPYYEDCLEGYWLLIIFDRLLFLSLW